jgi:HSP20 family protein
MKETMDRPKEGYSTESEVTETENWGIPLGAVQKGEKVIVKASLPGVKAKDIEVSIDGGLPTTKAKTSRKEECKDGDYVMRERRTSSLSRSLRLPDTINAEKAKATHTHGGEGAQAVDGGG